MANCGIITGRKINGTVGGIRSHMNRERESRTNPDIDSERTAENYNIEKGVEHLQKRVNARIKELNLKKAVRKDAVTLVDFVVTASPEAMQKMDAEQQKKYFEQSLDFLKDFYGKENFMYCVVHLDEKTPHAHIGFVPITKDGRLCAKEVISRTALRELQNGFFQNVSDKFGLERGEIGNTDRKHIDTTRLKVETAEKRASAAQEQEKKSVAHTEEIKKRMKLAQRDIEHLEKIQSRVSIKKKLLGKEERVEMSIGDYRSLQTMIERAIKSTTTFFELKKVADESEKRAKKVEKELAGEKATSEKLSKENAKLQSANKYFSEIPEQFRGYIKEGIEYDKRTIRQAFHDYNKCCGAILIKCNGDTNHAEKVIGKNFVSKALGAKILHSDYLKICAHECAAQIVKGKKPAKDKGGWSFPNPATTNYKEPISPNSQSVLDRLMGEEVYGIRGGAPDVADLTGSDAEKWKQWPYLSQAAREDLELKEFRKLI